MSNLESVGSIAGLWRFPVKSMRGEPLREAMVTTQGIFGDRAYALKEKETGKIVSAKSVKLYPDLMQCAAAFVEPPQPGASMPAVTMTLPDGTSVRSDSEDVDRVLSAYFKRDLTLAHAAPAEFTIDQYHPDIEGADPAGHRDKVVDQPLGTALFAAIGEESPLQVGSLLDAFPVSVLTTSTLARLSELQPGSRFDERRFRMNVIVATGQPGFLENGWLDRGLFLGDAVRINVTIPDPRCVMTTLPQGDLPRDTEILRTLVRHNKLQVGTMGQFPCAGVYAVVGAGGLIKIGDPVVLR
jgi:uncharacterized protein YcbX